MGDHYALGWLDTQWSVVVVGNPVMGGYTINYVKVEEKNEAEIKAVNPFLSSVFIPSPLPRTAASFFYILFRHYKSSSVTYPLGSVFSGPGAFGNIQKR